MNIIVMKSFMPTARKSGSDVVSYNLLKLLSQDHHVTFLGMAHGSSEISEATELRQFCDEVIVVPAPHKRSIVHRVLFRAVNTLKCILLLRSPVVSYNVPSSFLRTLSRLQLKKE